MAGHHFRNFFSSVDWGLLFDGELEVADEWDLNGGEGQLNGALSSLVAEIGGLDIAAVFQLVENGLDDRSLIFFSGGEHSSSVLYLGMVLGNELADKLILFALGDRGGVGWDGFNNSWDSLSDSDVLLNFSVHISWGIENYSLIGGRIVADFDFDSVVAGIKRGDVVDLGVGLLWNLHFLDLLNLKGLAYIYVNDFDDFAFDGRDGGDDSGCNFDGVDGFWCYDLTDFDGFLGDLGGGLLRVEIFVDNEFFSGGWGGDESDWWTVWFRDNHNCIDFDVRDLLLQHA